MMKPLKNDRRIDEVAAAAADVLIAVEAAFRKNAMLVPAAVAAASAKALLDETDQVERTFGMAAHDLAGWAPTLERLNEQERAGRARVAAAKLRRALLRIDSERLEKSVA
jgi:hypothetical protein